MTTYDEYLQSIRKTHEVTAKTAIAKLYELLKQEDSNLSKDDMYDRILKDLLLIWARTTIIRNMPDELKDKERQESGIKGAEKKKELVVTSNGSVATAWKLNNPDYEPESPTEPNSSTFEKPHDWELEKKEIFESNHKRDEKQDVESLRLENGKLKEMLTEQKKILDETIKSVNAAASLKKKDNVVGAVVDSLEYKALESQLYVIQQENKELKQIAQMQMKQNPTETFKPASDIKEAVTEVEFPAKELSTLFMDARIAKQVMYLKIQDGKVVSWESDTKRLGRRS